jgi:hypothetical protein
LREYHENLHSRVWRLAIKLRILEFSINIGANDQYLKAWNEFIGFFAPIEDCLRTDIIVTLYSLLDERGSKRSVIDYLKEVKKYLPGVMGQGASDADIRSLTSGIDAQLAEAKALKAIIDSVKFSRDKYYAHFHGKYFDKPEALATDISLPFTDVVKLVDFCQEVLNWHEAKVFELPVTIWSEESGREELERLLGFVLTYFNMHDEVRKRLGPDVLLEILKPKQGSLRSFA